jgi:hypothetical protein
VRRSSILVQAPPPRLEPTAGDYADLGLGKEGVLVTPEEGFAQMADLAGDNSQELVANGEEGCRDRLAPFWSPHRAHPGIPGQGRGRWRSRLDRLKFTYGLKQFLVSGLFKRSELPRVGSDWTRAHLGDDIAQLVFDSQTPTYWRPMVA